MNTTGPDSQTVQAFIESWGNMGILWGVNRSIARVHALLIASEEPLSLDHIAQTLDISRGNASMSLKELRAWGVVQRVSVSGDRRDYYESEPDVWRMFFQIMKERKRREFDPLIETIRAALEGAKPEAGSKVLDRLKQMEDLLTTMDKLMRRALADAGTSKTTLKFLTGTVLGGKG